MGAQAEAGSAPPQGTADHRNSPFQGPWGADTPVHSGSSALRDCGSEKSRGSPAATDAKPCGSCSSVQLKSEPPANTIPFKDGDTVSEPGKAPWWEAAVHLVTLMFGAGVLGLPYALASLGWILGILTLVLATCGSFYSALLLADLHTLRDGRRVRTLRALGEAVFGRAGRRAIVALQAGCMFTIGLTFIVAGGTSILGIVHGCYGDKGSACDEHEYATWPWSIAFGGAMILLSQFPDFHSLAWVSVVGAMMPIVYASIALVCILVHGKADAVDYSIVDAGSSFKTAMNMCSAVGTMSFAYGGQLVQNEVAATVATPPAVIVSMRRALRVAFAVIAAFYFAIAVAGYAMLGSAVTGNVLQSLPYAVPAIIANVAVLVHVGAAFQASAMPLYHLMEEHAATRKWLPARLARHPWLLRLTIRSLYVCLITFLAALIPFFTQLAGLVGGLGLGPLCFIAPILLWQRYNRDIASTARSLVNWTLIAVFAAVCVLATIGSVYSIAASAASFKVFA